MTQRSGKFAYWVSPHWTNRDDYPKSGETLPNWRWRWEFLRRSENYQRAWMAGEKRKDKNQKTAHPDDRFYADHYYRLPVLLNPTYRPNGKISIFSAEHAGCIARFGNPAHLIATARNCGAPNPLTILEDLFDRQQEIHDLIEARLLSMALFDLNCPIAPQLKKVEHMLKEQQKDQSGRLVQFRKRQTLWPTYLRLLDAKKQGATHKEIYCQFAEDRAEGDENRMDDFFRTGVQPKALVSQWLQQANEVRDKAIQYL